jgi:hypothetical protein
MRWLDEASNGSERPVLVNASLSADLPTDLLNLMVVHHAREKQRTNFEVGVWADKTHAYLLYKHEKRVELCRAGIDQDGKFKTWDVVALPNQAIEDQNIEDLIADMIDDGCWD